jgi:hypothetical protein
VYRDFRSSLISVTDFFSIQITFLLKLSFPILSDHLFYGYLLADVLITGNQDLLVLHAYRGILPILNPSDFIKKEAFTR